MSIVAQGGLGGMPESREETDKVADLLREVSYERRVVAFYDVLGWRSHIKRAAKKMEDISLLRRLILKTARATRMDKGLDLKVSTFSDNVVISQRPDGHLPADDAAERGHERYRHVVWRALHALAHVRDPRPERVGDEIEIELGDRQ